MASLNYFINKKDAPHVEVYRFDPLPDALNTELVNIPKQQSNSSGSVRLDTGSAQAQVYNWLGLPVFCSMRLIDPDNRTNSIDLLTVIVEVTQQKNIDTVAVNGVNGTIKTYFNDGDYDVKIQGMLSSSDPNGYPLEEVKKLVALLKVKKSLQVVCEYLALFDIHNIAVTDYSFPQLEGTQNTQLFDIAALSDEDIVILEKPQQQ